MHDSFLNEPWHDVRLEQIQLGVISKLYGASDSSAGAVRLRCSLATTIVDAMAISSRSKPRKIPFGWSIFLMFYRLFSYHTYSITESRKTHPVIFVAKASHGFEVICL